MSEPLRMRIRPTVRFSGELTLPGDKSLAHRALILGALANGEQIVSGLPPGGDVASTQRCLEQLGVRFAPDASGLRVLPPEVWRHEMDLDCGNSGTTARLLSGMIAGLGLSVRLTGDESLSDRPMERVAAPLRRLGGRVKTTDGHLPLRLEPGQLIGTHIDLPVASAQVKSAVLLAGLFATGTTSVSEPAASRDHTELMLEAMGANLRRDGRRTTVSGRGSFRSGGKNIEPVLNGLNLDLPGDLSTAAFFLAAAAAIPGARLTLRHVGTNPTRTGILDLMRAMGANIEVVEKGHQAGEPVADLQIKAGSLRATAVGGTMIPRLIDELPILAVLATQAAGLTVVRDAGELRHKESDRIVSTVTMLAKLGADIREREDGFEVHGPCTLRGGSVDSGGDHRLTMALAIAGLLAEGETVVSGAEAASVSHPEFWSNLARLTGPETIQSEPGHTP
jgi:3-phosphoshikimate 1-carboxyvinyltransferase